MRGTIGPTIQIRFRDPDGLIRTEDQAFDLTVTPDGYELIKPSTDPRERKLQRFRQLKQKHE